MLKSVHSVLAKTTIQLILVLTGSTVAEHLTQNREFKGLNPAADTGREKIGKRKYLGL
jgi:hypothetical protein